MFNFEGLVSLVEEFQITRIVDEKRGLYFHSSAPSFVQETTLEPVCGWLCTRCC